MHEENILIQEGVQQAELEEIVIEAEDPPESEGAIPEAEVLTDNVADEKVAEELAEDTAEESSETPKETTLEERETSEREVPDVSLPECDVAPYYERFYLKYRDGKRSAAMDLDGTRVFLQSIGFDGGELRRAREGKHRAEQLRDAGKAMNSQVYCSYCGAEISGVEFSRTPDGRIRCTGCSNSIVKTKAEAEALCQRVISNMNNFFGASIDVPVFVEIVAEQNLKKKIGVPLGTRDSQSLMILGVAVNKKNNYSILLENGVPRISLIATFVHELTHIWQYTHWDNKPNFQKCPENKRLLIYEGMAKWAEIQYLYLIGETNVAKREEFLTRNRQDVYGVAFCLYEQWYPLSRKAMTFGDTPFTPDRYPLD